MDQSALNHYVMHDDHLPTPFSAAQIRDATPAGHTVETHTRNDTGRIARGRTVFVEVDGDGATMEAVRAVADEDFGEPVRARASWRELQSHASFPADAATRERDEIQTPLGRLVCWRYEVTAPDGVRVFWFADDYPGMPVRYGVRGLGGTLSEWTTVVRVD
jgi:hypothetical protein